MSEITNQPLYLIKFDDTEVPDETMFGADVANKRFEQISGNWNAHLFVKVASNSHDDSCSGSNAKLASDYDALAAQRDEAVAAHEALGKVYAFTQLGFEKMMAQRDEGLAREADLHRTVARKIEAYQFQRALRTEDRASIDALRQRLAEAEKLLRLYHGEPTMFAFKSEVIAQFLASLDCPDGEKVE